MTIFAAPEQRKGKNRYSFFAIPLLIYKKVSHHNLCKGDAMNPERRLLTVFTPGKIYTGEVDLPNPLLRTTDLLNSPNLFWKDPSQKSFSDALLMHNAILAIDGIDKYQTFDSIQIRHPNIIFFHDGYAELGSSKEKERILKMTVQNPETKNTIHLITKTRVNSFFEITGTFHGLLKGKANQKYIPINDVTLYEIIRRQDKWVKRKIELTNNFIGVNSNYIESSSLR